MTLPWFMEIIAVLKPAVKMAKTDSMLVEMVRNDHQLSVLTCQSLLMLLGVTNFHHDKLAAAWLRSRKSQS